MIRIDAIWLATEPMDMRSGTEKALARVVAVFGAAQPHCAYLFANRRGNLDCPRRHRHLQPMHIIHYERAQMIYHHVTTRAPLLFG
nr:IS66 family insertion sequence element accessory protein TnpB [Pseudomonas sp. CBZ-4]